MFKMSWYTHRKAKTCEPLASALTVLITGYVLLKVKQPRVLILL